MSNLVELLLRMHNTVREVVERLDASHKGIVLIVDETDALLTTITDGDVRRAMLAGIRLSDSVQKLLDQKAHSLPVQPITVPAGTSEDTIRGIMQREKIRHVPVINDERHVIDIVMREDLFEPAPLGVTAVVMAGGFGRRLAPLTSNTPKPLLPVGGKPLIETIVRKLADDGVRSINITTHYHGELISAHLGDGHDQGINISYIDEERPLGTAGALRFLPDPTESVLVMNGDILTNLNIAALHEFHSQHDADVTVAVREYAFEVPFGVVQAVDDRIRCIEEKPEYRFFVSAGIYLLEPRVLRDLPREPEHLDMPDFVNHLIRAGRRAVSYPIREYWLDIGQLSDYERAQIDFDAGCIT